MFLNSNKGKYTLSILFLIVFDLFLFREYLSFDVIINATDILTQDYFWHAFYHNQLHNFPSFVTWNPYLNGGATFYGGLHLIFLPISLLSTYLFPPNFAITAEALIHLFLAGLFTLLYARLLGLSFLSSFLAATFFMLSTEVVSLLNAGHIGKLNTIALFPLVLLTLERALQKRRFIDFVLVAGALSLQLYETHIQISFYSCIAVGIYFIWRSVNIYLEERSKPAEIARLYSYGAVMVILFLMLSASSLVNWFEFKAQSERSSGTTYEFATSWSMPKKELVTYIVPQFFGLNRENYDDPGKIKVFYWGEMSFTQTVDYLGLLPLFLAVIALFKYRNRYVYLFLALAILFQVLALGKYTPVYYFFYKYLGFGFFRVPKMNLFIVAFTVAMMAGYGAQWLLQELTEKDRRFFKKVTIFIFIFSAFLALITVFASLSQADLIQYFKRELSGVGEAYNPYLAGKRYQYALEGMMAASGLMMVGGIIFSLRFIRSLKAELFFVLLLSYFLVDISLVNNKFIDSVPMKGNAYFSKDTAIEYFERDKGLYRVLNAIWDRTMESVPYRVPNKYILYKMHSATGYEAVQLARYNDYLDNLDLGSNFMDLLNVKYIVLQKNGMQGRVGDKIGKYEIVVDEDVKVLRNMDVIPRVFPVHKAMVLTDKNLVLMWLNNPLFDPRNTVLLEKDINMPLIQSPRSETESTVRITSYKNSEIHVDANMADNGFVVLSEKYYPGWKAYLDGKQTEIFQADYVFRAVYVPLGAHKLIVRYEPDSYEKGLYITLAALLFVAAIAARHYFTVSITRK